jgi:hypothetical protein
LWQTKKRYVILMGGRGAGRSLETPQKIVANLVQTKRRFRAAITRAVIADIRHSNWQELTDPPRGFVGIEPALRVADSTMGMEHGNNSVHGVNARDRKVLPTPKEAERTLF